MEEKNDIFLTGGDALVYLAVLMHKKYSTTFVREHPFITYAIKRVCYRKGFSIQHALFSLIEKWKKVLDNKG